MTVIADNKKRVTIPAKPGDRFDVQCFGADKFVLTRLEPKARQAAKVVLIKRAGRTMARTDQEISLTSIKEALAEFP